MWPFKHSCMHSIGDISILFFTPMYWHIRWKYEGKLILTYQIIVTEGSYSDCRTIFYFLRKSSKKASSYNKLSNKVCKYSCVLLHIRQLYHTSMEPILNMVGVLGVNIWNCPCIMVGILNVNMPNWPMYRALLKCTNMVLVQVLYHD